jgi:hypothetical protein
MGGKQADATLRPKSCATTDQRHHESFEMNSLCERAGLNEAASEANADICWKGPSNWDVQRQIET